MDVKSVMTPKFFDFPAIEKPGQVYTSTRGLLEGKPYLNEKTARLYNEVRMLYDTVLKLMFNFRQSGHPGGAISMGPHLIGLFLDSLRYDISRPDDLKNDVVGLSSGHKTNGLYALLTILFEAVKLREPSALPKDALLFKDLLGFRRNVTYHSRLVDQLHPTRLEGHPIPETPFVRIASGASGYAVSQFMGLALNLRERFQGDRPPLVYILEGDGAATTGRYQEALQVAHNLKLGNLALLFDFNNADIDENQVVCRITPEGVKEGHVASWAPEELGRTHGANVISINDGHDFNQIIAGLDAIREMISLNPRFAMGVFYTVKSKCYDPAGGVCGRKFHGAGHKTDSPEYWACQQEFEDYFNVKLPHLPEGSKSRDENESYFLKNLETVLELMKSRTELTDFIAERIFAAKDKIPQNRKTAATDLKPLMEYVPETPIQITPPAELVMPSGKASYREQYVKTVGYINKLTKNAFWVVSADLLSSTLPGITAYLGGKGENYKYAESEFYYGENNRDSRILHGGGITEDANAGLLLGLGALGTYTGVSTSYGAFQSLAHTHVRVSVGPSGSHERELRAPIQIGAFHASLWTGPDGVRTHADPQALSTWWENFPYGSVISLLPIDPNEIYPLMIAAYRKKPVAIVPFIARPDGIAFDREKLGFAPAVEAARGAYILKAAKPGKSHGTVVLQGAGVAKIFIEEVMTNLEEKWNFNLVVIASPELFRMQPSEYQNAVLPYLDADQTRRNSVAITEFTEGTIRPYVDALGLRYSLFSYKPLSQLGKDPNETESVGPYGSGEPEEIFREAGLDAQGQYLAVDSYLTRINR